MKKLFGIIGFPLAHSFSQKYFTEKFRNEGIMDAEFQVFPLEDIQEFPGLIASHANLNGLSVTIPYKEKVIPFLNDLDESAASVGAVNSIKVDKTGSRVWLTGYNTDVYGFMKSLEQLSLPPNLRALVLGTGGASKAVCHVLQQKGIGHLVVSRNPSKTGQISYGDISTDLLQQTLLVINASPVGTFPGTDQCPVLPYNALTPDHILFDLVYNPALTLFLIKGQQKGCTVKNGADMLVFQAQKSWGLWNDLTGEQRGH